MPAPLNNRVKSENVSPGKRLDSWKEIAVYLGRGERTVKRWEAERGLPTHRVPGKGRPSVYAYSRELDEWLKSGGGQDRDSEPDVPEEPEPPAPSASVSAMPPLASGPVQDRLPAPRASRPAGSRRLILAAYGLLLAAACIAILHFAGVRLSLASSWVLAKGKPKPGEAAPPPVSPGSEKALAHDFYLKGRYEWNQRTPDSLNRALDAFTQAIVHDPNDAQAYVGLADTYDLMREYTTMSDGEAFSRAIVAARKAVEIDDSLAEAHRALAFAERYGSWDFADAEKEFRRAIELNPKDPEARRWYANAYAMPGRYPEMLAQIEKAQELDPSSHATLADKGLMLFDSGRRDEGIAILQEVERAVPEFRSPHLYLMRIYLDLHNYPGFLEEGGKTADSMNDSALKDIVSSARAAYARDGDGGMLRSLYAKQKEYYLRGKLYATVLAKTCVLLGSRQEALELLEEAYAHRESEVIACLSDPILLTLKDEPRYKALVKKINLPASRNDGSARPLPEIQGSSLQAAPIPH